MNETVTPTEKVKYFLYENPIIFTYISWVLSSLFFAFLPIILFVIFMNDESFFSYDFFTNGLFGMKIFFLFSLTIVVFSSLMLFCVFVLLIENFYKKTKINDENDTNSNKNQLNDKKTISWVLFINVFSHALFIMVFSNLDKLGFYLYLASIGFFISFHIGMILYAKSQHKLVSLVILIPMVIVISITLGKHTSQIIKIGLKQYGVGGDVEIIIQPKFNDNNKIRGKLVLLSPNRIFYKKDDSPFISIVERSRYDVTTIFRNFDEKKEINDEKIETN